MVGRRQRKDRAGRQDGCDRCGQFLVAWASAARGRRVPRQVQLVEQEVGGDDPALQAISGAVPSPEIDADETAPARTDDSLAPLPDLVAIGILTPLEAAALTAAFSILRDGKRASWRAVAKIAGCRHQVARETVLRALHRWHTTAKLSDRMVTSKEQVVIRVRGTRQRDVWTRESQRVGRGGRSKSKRETDRRKRRKVLKDSPRTEDRQYRAYRNSPMRELLNALTVHLTTGPNGALETDPETGRFLASPDWPHNLHWAIRKLQRAARAKKHIPPVAFKDYLLALARGCPPCRNCRTPILIGCHLEGRRINRSRGFCDEACKMQAERRKKPHA